MPVLKTLLQHCQVLILLFIATSISSQVESNSLDFDGVDDYIEFRNTGGDFGSVSNFQGAFTFEAWVKNEGFSYWARIFELFDSSNDFMYLTSRSGISGQLEWGYRTGGNVHHRLNGGFLPYNTWTHLALTLDASGNAKIYQNGILADSTSSWPTIDAIYGVSNAAIGKPYLVPSEPTFNGKMQEVRFWKEARTQQEIIDWKDHRLSGQENNLIAYLKLNDGLAGQNSGEIYAQNCGLTSYYSPQLHNFNFNATSSNWLADSGMPIDVNENNAVEFFNGNEYYSLANEANFDFANEFTVEFLLQGNFDDGHYHNCINKGPLSGPLSFYVNFHGGIAEFGHASGNGNYNFLQAHNVFSGNEWNHYAFTARQEHGGSVRRRIFVNGVLAAEQLFPNESIPQNNSQVKIGQYTYGKLSNIRFWNKALGETSISKNINTVYPTGTPNLVAQYTTYNNYGIGLIDHIGGNTGVRNAAPSFTSDPCVVLFDEQPEDTTFTDFGQNLLLSVSTIGSTTNNYSYQWQKDGADWHGNASTLTPNLSSANIMVDDLGVYRCKITSCGQTYYSKEATVRVENEGTTLHFDGIDDQIRWSGQSSDTKYGVEGWFRFDEDPVNQNIIVHGDQSSDFKNLATRWMRVNEKGYLEHASYSQTTGDNMEMKVVEYPEKLVANKWYHFNIVYNTVFVYVRLNGIISPTTSVHQATSTSTASDWNLGGAVEGYSPFKGEIADLRIWDLEGQTMNEPVPVSTNELVYYFNFDEGIADADNKSPILENMVNNEVVGSPVSQVELLNFDLEGSTSNWRGCDNYSTELTVNITNQSNQINGFISEFIPVGNALNLTSSVTGADGSQSYQWLKDGQPIPGANAPNYTETVDIYDEGRYSLRVDYFNACPTFSNEIDIAVKGTGSVLNFDGIDDYVEVGGVMPSAVFTMETWVKFEGSPNGQAIVTGTSKAGALIAVGPQFVVDDNGYLTFSLFDSAAGVARLIKSDQVIVQDRWYHIAGRALNGSSMEMLVDGVVQSQTTNPGTIGTFIDRFNIGGQANLNLERYSFFKGEMDEFRYWTTNHNNQFILQNKDRELTNNFFNPQVYLKFNQGYPDQDNTGFDPNSLPTHKTRSDIQLGNYMYNFDFEGPVSNFSNCSPVTTPTPYPGLVFEAATEITNINGNQVVFGHPFKLISGIQEDTSTVSFQWFKDDVEIPGATSGSYFIEEFMPSDTGQYALRVEDTCDPPYIDTGYLYTINYKCLSDFTTFHIDPTVNDTIIDCYSMFQLCSGGGDTLGLENNIYGAYCGSDIVYNDPEKIYEITFTQSRVLFAKIEGMTEPMDFFLYGDDCDMSNCIASSTNGGLLADSLQVGLSPGTYYLVLDGASEFGEAPLEYTLTFDVFDSKCEESLPLACGTSVSDDTGLGSNFIEEYCGELGYGGNEKIYQVDLDHAQTLIFNLSNASVDLDIFLLDSTCFENGCILSSTNGPGLDEDLVYGAQAGTYYLVVDGKKGATGSFDLSLECVDYFTASYDDNDAYIDLTWSIDKKLCVPQDTGVIVRLITPPSTILFEEIFNTAELTPDIISGTYRHYVGDNHSQMYALKVYNRLSNATLCNEIDTGRTTPFAMPEIVSISNPEFPDSVRISWRNHSKLSDQFRLFRDGEQIINLIDGYTEDSLIIDYVESHDINDTSSIQAATAYNYCIETFSSQLGQSYPQVCAPASTVDVNFMATNGTPIDQVQLTWNDVSAFCTGIQIKRNGIIEQILSPNQTFYNDMDPLYGIPTTYSMALLNDSQVKMEFEALGFAPANGEIQGRVITDEGSYPVAGVKIILKKDTIIGGFPDLTLVDSLFTDFTGAFSFDGVVYGLTTNFTLTASKDGSVFSDNDLAVTLDEVSSSIGGVVFIDESDLNLELSPGLIDSFYYTSMDAEDLIDLEWDYTYNSSDTLFFNLFREGNLIYSASDAEGQTTNFVDLDGAPGTIYSYTLQVSQIVGDTTYLEEISKDITYPLLTPVSNLTVNTGSYQGSNGEIEDFNPRIFMDWSEFNHTSQNFDGFRLFRNGQLLTEVEANNEQYQQLSAPGSKAVYQIRAFKTINGITYQSTAFPTSPDSITTNDLWTPIISETSSRRITLDIGSLGYQQEFFEADIYDGVLVERKLTAESDDAYEVIGEFSRDYIAATALMEGTSPVFYDQYGIPGSNYDYKMSTYIEIDGQVYKQSEVAAGLCPDIVPPLNLTASAIEGQVDLSWQDQSTSNGPSSLLFVQYEGYELRRVDGTDTVLIATLPSGTESYRDFINNPVYDIFFDTYFNKTFDYVLQSYLDIDGVRYYSSPVTDDATPPAGSTAEPLPIDLVASDNIPSHVKVCWDWTAAKQSEFIIYRNDTIALDTLPFTARAYYDYGAPEGVNVKYSISSLHSGNESAKVSVEGSIPTLITIRGRVYNQQTGSGLPGVFVDYANQAFAPYVLDQFVGNTTTDSSGNYSFVGIPNIPGITFLVDVTRINTDFNPSPTGYSSFDTDPITLDGNTEYVLDFIDYQTTADTLEIAQVNAVVATPIAPGLRVKIDWSTDNMNYDGVEIYRANLKIAEIMKGDGYTFYDSLGFPDISYGYGVQAFRETMTGREFSELKTDGAKFPALEPVQNLTATGFFNENKMLISWSHPYDNHDSYRVLRDGVFQASIPAGTEMMWYDMTGVPGQFYQYEVSAIKGNIVSPPVVINTNYKGVGEVRNLSASVNTSIPACAGETTNNNHILLNWEYNFRAAEGFEIYRDGKLIAEIDSTDLSFGDLPIVPGQTLVDGNQVTYLDFNGLPDTAHTYHVLAYVEREETRFTSGIEELYLKETITYPELAHVSVLDVGPNDVLGAAQVSWEYDADIVTGFEILRDGAVLDTVFAASDTAFIYFDNTGLPNTPYDYAVRAFDRRNGTVYFGNTVCSYTINFPIVPVPQNFAASKGTFVNHIEVSWDFDENAFVDSFYVENMTLGTSNNYYGGKRRHLDIVNEFTEQEYEYRIRASRAVNGQVVYSLWSPIEIGWSQKQKNGSPSDETVGDIESTYLGWSTAIDGDWAVAGAHDGQESAHIYKRNEGGWSLHQVLPSPGGGTDIDFGFTVDISGDKIVVGAPLGNKAFIYQRFGEEWVWVQEISGSSGTNYGWSVAIDQDDLVIGAPSAGNGGQGFIYALVNDRFVLQSNETGYLWNQDGSNQTNIVEAYEDLDIHDGLLVFSMDDHTTKYIVTYEKNANGVWAYKQFYGAGTRELNILRASNRLKVIDDAIIFGNFIDNGPNGSYTGRVEVYHLDANKNLSSQEFFNPAIEQQNDHFGYDVSAAWIPSPVDDVLHVLVGALDGGNHPTGSYSGEAFLYAKKNGVWEVVETYSNPANTNDYLGHSVALSKDALIYGIPLKYDNDRGEVGIHNLIKAPSYVEATDGISLDFDPTETTITWEFDGDVDLVSGFDIFRDGLFLTFRDIATTNLIAPNVIGGSWNDNSGKAGQKYVYSVKTINTLSGFKSSGTSDEGYNAPNGKIQGSVITAMDGIPVPGVTVNAVGFVNGERYEYEGTTFANGEYVITNVFYDSDPDIASFYTVSASFADHSIIASPTDVATLNSLNEPVVGIVNFLDESAYVVTGQLSQANVNCPVQGVRVAPVYNGVPSFADETTTDENGRYSIVINPNDPSLLELRIRVNNIWTQNGDSLNYAYISMDDTVYTNFVNFPFKTEVNFEDTLTYPVSIKVKNTCNDAISASSWDVRIRTLDGCFDEIYTTNFNGDLIADLLPLNYTMKVVGVSETNTVNQQALNYLSGKPIPLNLLDLHRDSFDLKSRQEIADLAAAQFTYHVAPQIEVSGISEFFCNQPVGVLQQGETYVLNFDITEPFNGTDCPVQEGKINIYNPAAQDEFNALIEYDELLEEFPLYTFVAGNPLQADPYIYGINVDYLSDEGDFLGRTVVSVFVEGSVTLPGSDIIVDPSNGNDAVPMPILVLRDPPGDHSYSYISGGQTINYTTAVTEANNNTQSVYLNTNVVGLGAADIGINGNFSTGTGTRDGKEYSSEITISQTIKTSDDEFFIGRNADIIVGQGLVMTNGIVRQYSIGTCDTIDVIEISSISPDQASTTWSYTIEQVEDIITGYRNDSMRIEIGQKFIEERGKILSKEDAIKKVTTYIKNWESVLMYHDENTVPHYRICAEDPPLQSGFLVFGQQQQIDEWQSKLCPLLGSGEGEDFQLNSDISWSNATMDMYNAAFFAIDNIANGNNASGQWTYPSNDNISTILNNPVVTAHISSFGAPVKNVTTGGFVEIEETFSSVNSGSSSHEVNYFRSGGFGVSATFTADFTVVAGGFAGAGVGAFAGVFYGTVREIFSKNLSIGADFNWSFEKSRSSSLAITNEVETGYVIFDDDITDQFSMSVIQPVNQNQTAYFDYFGGRTSCPPEPGSIAVDAPSIFIVEENPNGTTSLTDNKTIHNVPANGAATFTIRIDNLTPVPSMPDRDTRVFLEQSSNVNGAVVKLAGVNLSNANFEDSLAANSPVDLTLTIERGPQFYEYEDIQIFISPTCFEEPREEIFLSAFFQSPCSPVTLTAPSNNWVVNDNMPLVVSMQDYDTLNPIFDKAILEYRRLGTGDDWDGVSAVELDNGNDISKAELAMHNRGLAFGQTPIYNFIWHIPETFVDGDYEVRIKMECDDGNIITLSNTSVGKIARNTLNLFGTPQPADQVWTAGDEISFSFNLPLNCVDVDNALFEGENVYIYNETTGDTLDFSMDCYGNQLVFLLDDPMSTYDGHFLTVSVDEVVSLNGNISEKFDWTFRVITQQLYWADADTVKFRLYRDAESAYVARINSTESFPVNGVDLRPAGGGAIAPWITNLVPTANTTFSVPPITGTDVQLTVEANQPLGIYNETLEIGGLSGNVPKLHIQLEILAKPPNWVVNPGDFSTSMNMISNWTYTTEPDTLSTDISDIISVWAGSEIRGVGNIVKSGDFYASYLTIYGDIEDNDVTPLEFRVWDADLGIEYDGHPQQTDTIFFEANALRGTTTNPEMLEVDSVYDAVQYIILPQAGWNGFSLNTKTNSMDVVHKLRSLKHVAEGDLIVTGDEFRQYSDSLGWFGFGSVDLSDLEITDGYMIYLQNGPDTLRVTGVADTTSVKELEEGWNWIGTPFQEAVELTDANNVNAFELQSDNGEFRINMDFPSGNTPAGFALYNNGMGTWDDTALPEIVPHNLFKIFVQNPIGSTLCWGGCSGSGNAKDGGNSSNNRLFTVTADPNNAATWTMPDYKTEDVMPVIAEVLVGGIAVSDVNDKVAFFDADTIVALANVEYVAAVDAYELSLLAEQIDASNFDVRYYDASEDTILIASNVLAFDRDGEGDVFDPYEIIFQAQPCPQHLVLTPAHSPLNGLYEASQTITIQGILNVLDNAAVIFNAPSVTVENQLNNGAGAMITVQPDGCND